MGNELPKRRLHHLQNYDYSQSRMTAEYIQSNPQNWHKDCFYEEPPHEP